MQGLSVELCKPRATAFARNNSMSVNGLQLKNSSHACNAIYYIYKRQCKDIKVQGYRERVFAYALSIYSPFTGIESCSFLHEKTKTKKEKKAFALI